MSRILWADTLAAPRTMSTTHPLAGARPVGPFAIGALRLGLALLLTLALAMLGTCAHAATIIVG